MYKSILADCQLRQVDVYSRFIAGLIRGRPGLKARAEILPLAHDPTHGDRLCNKLVPSSYQLNPLTLNYPWLRAHFLSVLSQLACRKRSANDAAPIINIPSILV